MTNRLQTATDRPGLAARLGRRASAGLAAAAVSVGLLAAVAPPAQAAPAGCQLDCITAVTVSAGPEQARIQVSTTVLSRVHISVQRSDNGGPAQYMASTTMATAHDKTTAANLGQSSQYRYRVVATDAFGGSWAQVGYFVTSERRMTVTPQKLTIDDDSDVWSAGDLVGAIHLMDKCGEPKPLSPLSMTTTKQVSGGTTLTMGSAATIDCNLVPSSMRLETYVADDDTDAGENCSDWWPWYFGNRAWGGSYGGNSCADWNNGATTFTDALSPTAANGDTSVAFTHKSVQKTWDGFPIDPKWTVTGTVRYRHTKPSVTLPASFTNNEEVHASTFPGNAQLVVSWVPATVPGVTMTGYRVTYRATGSGDPFTTININSAASSNTTITGLVNGQQYDVRVVARDAAGVLYGLSEATGTPNGALAATTIAWDSTDVVQPSGTSAGALGTVTTIGDPRPIALQRRSNTDGSWSTVWTGSSAANGDIGVPIPVIVGRYQYRVSVPVAPGLAAAISTSKWVSAQTTIADFDTAPVAADPGTTIADTVTVTPGDARTLEVVKRLVGTSSWTVHATAKANAVGAAAVTLLVQPGDYEWAVRAQPDTSYGAGAITAVRTVSGLGKATTISGWTTASATLPVGSTVSTKVKVSKGAALRSIKVQYRLPGSATWAVHATVKTATDGTATVSYPVKKGQVAWRLVVAPDFEYLGATTPQRTITARTVISGFSVANATAKAGTTLKDAFTVAPGAGRSVKVQYRLTGTSTWTTYQTLTASSTGTATATIAVKKGSYEWRVYTQLSIYHGSAAASGRRTVVGT